MENLKNRIENWQKSEMSKDEGNASSVWQFNRKLYGFAYAQHIYMKNFL